MNDLASSGAMAFSPLVVSRWFTTAPHELADGVQMTGWGPFSSLGCQPSERSCAPRPEDFFATFTNAHPLANLAASDSLNFSASCVSSSTFSGELATSTWAQLAPAASFPPIPHDARRRAATRVSSSGVGRGRVRIIDSRPST